VIGFLQEIVRTFEFFPDSYLATLAIALVVSYLGVLVVLKRIVFLGVTLSQAAAAGIALAFFAQGFYEHGSAVGEMIEEHGPTLGALGLSSLSVAAFALPAESKKISREALLGLGYALFGGASILLVWRSAKGIDELKNLLAGDVLFARTYLSTLLLGLGGVAVLHGCLRKEFLLTSYDPEFARTLRMPVKLYEVLLLLSLGVAVSLALKVAGILLVFAFLSVPPIAGLSLGKKLGPATLVALGVAAASSALGLIIATRADLPVAPTIACLLVAFAAVAAVAAKIGERAKKAYVGVVAVLALAALGAAVDAAVKHEGFASMSELPRKDVAPLASGVVPTSQEALDRFRRAASPEVRLEAAKAIVESGDDRTLAKFVRLALGDEDETMRETAIAALGKFTDRTRAVRAVEPLLGADDAPLRLHAALGLVQLGDGRGVQSLVGTLSDKHADPGTRQEALDALLKINPEGAKLGYDAFADDAANHKAVTRWEAWWRSQAASVPRKAP
jgi:zinc transport system permease protein